MNSMLKGRTLVSVFGFLVLGFVCLGGGVVFAQDDFNAGSGSGSGSAVAEAGSGSPEGSGSGAGSAEAGSAEAGSAEAGSAEAGSGLPAEAGSGSGLGSAEIGSAEEVSPSGLKAGIDEADQVENLVEKFPYKLDKEAKDPFKPIVEKKVAALPQMQAPKPMATKANANAAPPPPPPPPLKMIVTGIVGNDADRLAMVSFENELITIKKDQDVKGKFKVVDILNDKVVVYSNKEQMRRTFPIGGGKE